MADPVDYIVISSDSEDEGNSSSMDVVQETIECYPDLLLDTGNADFAGIYAPLEYFDEIENMILNDSNEILLTGYPDPASIIFSTTLIDLYLTPENLHDAHLLQNAGYKYIGHTVGIVNENNSLRDDSSVEDRNGSSSGFGSEDDMPRLHLDTSDSEDNNVQPEVKNQVEVIANIHQDPCSPVDSSDKSVPEDQPNNLNSMKQVEKYVAPASEETIMRIEPAQTMNNQGHLQNGIDTNLAGNSYYNSSLVHVDHDISPVNMEELDKYFEEILIYVAIRDIIDSIPPEYCKQLEIYALHFALILENSEEYTKMTQIENCGNNNEVQKKMKKKPKVRKEAVQPKPNKTIINEHPVSVETDAPISTRTRSCIALRRAAERRLDTNMSKESSTMNIQQQQNEKAPQRVTRYRRCKSPSFMNKRFKETF